jgi:hypothetical protein
MAKRMIGRASWRQCHEKTKRGEDFEIIQKAVGHYMRKGEWVYTGHDNKWECSNCESQMDLSDDEQGHPHYCPSCGTNMRGAK